MTTALPQALIESVLEAVWLVDAVDLRIIAVNRAAEALTGLPRERLLGQPVVDFASTSQDLFFWEDVAAGRSRSILLSAGGSAPRSSGSARRRARRRTGW